MYPLKRVLIKYVLDINDYNFEPDYFLLWLLLRILYCSKPCRIYQNSILLTLEKQHCILNYLSDKDC